jgi:hypothetical protein
MPAVPDKGLHANRAYSIPTDDGPKNCYSRTDILTAKTPAAFGSGQSLEVCTNGESQKNPATWPKDWYKKGRVLKVPKTVVLSSFPFWTLYWPKACFYFPRDVIGDSGYGFLNNYYYLEQWNGLDTSITEANPDYDWLKEYDVSDPRVVSGLSGASGYTNNRAWKDMRNLDPADKGGVYNSQMNCRFMSQDGRECESIPAYLINKCPTPPMDERYFKGVATIENPYYRLHPQLLDAFLAAKKLLEGDPKDPIYVDIPNWMPRTMYQVRNAYLKQTHEKLNRGHGGAINHRPCEVADTIPCHTYENICWAPPYPDVADPRNNPGFSGPTVPWLMSTRPGFGTNTLHLYIGHPNMAYFPADFFHNYQAWPLSPEMVYEAGPVGAGSYLGDPRPYYAGRRPVWRAYGYANHGAQGLWDTRYSGIVQGAADVYKDAFWKFRNFGTRIFTYNVSWPWGWDFGRLYDDRRNDCPSTQFYMGFDFSEFAREYDGVDTNITDCNWHDHLPVGETHNYFPSQASIDEAVGVGVRLSQRVMDYYNNNDAGSAKFFQIALGKTGPGDFNASYEGSMPGEFLDPDGIVAYVREYFKDHR